MSITSEKEDPPDLDTDSNSTVMENSDRVGTELEWDSTDMNMYRQTVKVNKRKERDEEIVGEQEEDYEGFIDVDRRIKKPNINRSPTQSSAILLIHQEKAVEIVVTSKEVLPKQIGLAKVLQKEGVRDVIKVSYKSPYKVLISFKNEMSAQYLMNNVIFTEKGWNMKKKGDVNFSYGLLREIDLELSDKEVESSITSDVEIVQIKRLNKKNGEGKWIKSELARICFKGPTLPPYVYSYGVRVKVEPFLFPVTQCSNCWKYGHVRNFCPIKNKVCPKCGKDHENCDTQTFYCVNCKGDHMSILKSKCPVFLKEREIRKIMANFNWSYKAAMDFYSEKNKATFITEKGNNAYKKLQGMEIIQTDANNIEKTTHKVSYAKVVQGTYSRKDIEENGYSSNSENIQNVSGIKKTKKKSSNRRNKNREEAKDSTDSSSTSDKEYVNNDQEEIKTKKERIFKKKDFINKIKEIFFSQSEFRKKIMSVIKVIIKEVKSFIENNINGEMLLSWWKWICNNG